MRPGNWFFLFSLFTVTLFLTGCQSGSGTQKEPDERPLFTLLAPEKTHVDFANTLTEGLNTNVLMYEYFYNGGGVAVGDLNNDGLQDLYFSANMVSNRLYLNRGNMQFEDITKQSGAGGREGPWKTGVTMADVNGDGLLDMYACYSGKISGDKRVNQLFINQGTDAQGVPHFEEQAQQYGLADSSFSNHAVFFDFDRDHDLDLLLLNHNPQRLSNLDDITLIEILKKPAPQIGVKLFRNDNGHFQEITQQAGLRSTALSYGLGAGVSDVNGDGWPDIYLSNDYLAPDYLYINQGNGTFKDQIAGSLGHTSQFSMGNDISDINNDGLPDITTLDMLPEDNQRQKLLFAPDNYELFDLNLRAGLHHQYMRNMLQVNNGDGTFSEVGQLAGIANTDWSWAPLWADYDNDGWKDLYITNGYVRDYTNMDFLKYMGDYLQQFQGNLRRQNLLDLVYKIPSSHISDYLYKSNGANLSFTDKTTAWGLHRNSNSNGAVYADLDNDGDLDLVVNNINQPAFIYQNEANALPNRHYLAVKLEGTGKNRNGVGAKVTLYSQGQQQYLEQVPSRGFQSSVSPRLHFGVGAAQTIDSVRVVWLGNGQQVLRQVKADQVLTIREADARPERPPVRPATLFEEITSPLAFRHQSAPVNDFKRQPLLVTPQSFVGPCLAKGDVNGDGREDVYVGGGVGQAGALYLSQTNGSFRPGPVPAFDADKESNDADAVFFDANGDGALDLYVCSGGYDAYLPDDPRLQDRLYLNDGRGHFTKSPTALPALRTSKSCVRVADANGDGKPDLFVGGRVIPGRYPETPPSFLLINDGRGNFRDQTAQLAPQLQRVGMVTDAAWLDLNGDKRPELIVVGEWMPITVFGQTDGQWTEQTDRYFDKTYRGWWNKLLVADVNGDGQSDLVVGNLGLNSQCKASDQQPAELYYKDFDDNGSVDPVLCFYIQGKTYPYVFRDELLDQISLMRTRFPDYKSYADATMKEVFTAEELNGADRLEANYLKTACFLRKPGGKFVEQSLPVEAQFAPVCALLSLDYNQDGHPDLLLAGNQNQARLHFGKYDANYGLLLQGDGKGHFKAIPQRQSGFRLQGDVRSLLPVNQTILVGINQQPLKAYRLRGPSSAPSVVAAKGDRRE